MLVAQLAWSGRRPQATYPSHAACSRRFGRSSIGIEFEPPHAAAPASEAPASSSKDARRSAEGMERATDLECMEDPQGNGAGERRPTPTTLSYKQSQNQPAARPEPSGFAARVDRIGDAVQAGLASGVRTADLLRPAAWFA